MYFKEIAEEVGKQADLMRGTRFIKAVQFELWSRQRLFKSFQSTLTGYWRTIKNPFLNRAYARFCFSLPRAVLEGRRLLGDVFRRYYGPLAVIPGTYSDQPYILTGTYLLKRRIAKSLPVTSQYGPFGGFDNVPHRMDIESIQATGKDALCLYLIPGAGFLSGWIWTCWSRSTRR